MVSTIIFTLGTILQLKPWFLSFYLNQLTKSLFTFGA